MRLYHPATNGPLDRAVAMGVPVTVSVSGGVVGRRTAVVPANDRRIVRLTADVGDAPRLTVATPGNRTTMDLAAAPDVNGDGQFEDVDGSGELTIVDVAVLLEET